MKIISIDCTKREAVQSFNEWKSNTEMYINHCEACGSKEQLTIHHIDGDKRNNDFSNLKYLCWDCHKIIHNTEFQVRYLYDKEIKSKGIKEISKNIDNNKIKIVSKFKNNGCILMDHNDIGNKFIIMTENEFKYITGKRLH